MIKAVLDTNVLVSSLIQPLGHPAAILDLFIVGEIDLVVNDAVLAEYEDVLNRPKFNFPRNLVAGTVGYLRAKSSRCYSIPQTDSLPDPDDKVFWDLAVTNNAVLVTGNAKHFPASEIVMSPGRFLQFYHEQR